MHCFLQEAELNEREMEHKMEEFRRQIVEEERQKLLKAHAEKLIGYLPKVSSLPVCLNGATSAVQFEQITYQVLISLKFRFDEV